MCDLPIRELLGTYELEHALVVFALEDEEHSVDPARPLLGRPTPCVGRERELALADPIRSAASCGLRPDASPEDNHARLAARIGAQLNADLAITTAFLAADEAVANADELGPLGVVEPAMRVSAARARFAAGRTAEATADVQRALRALQVRLSRLHHAEQRRRACVEVPENAALMQLAQALGVSLDGIESSLS